MRSFLWLSLVAASVAADCSAIQDNTDYYGNDIANVVRPSAEYCCADCLANPNCVVAVWWDGVCYLKNKIGTKSSTTGARAVIPNRAAATSCPSIQENTDYYGNDIANVARPSADYCCADCLATTNCVAAVWWDGVCYLKNKIGAKSSLTGARAVIPTRTTQSTPAPASAPKDSLPVSKVRAGFTYPSNYRSGSYSMVTDLNGCQKRSVSSAGPIAPYHEDVTFVFRGPMDIYNIAIFQPASDGSWSRVSSYDRSSGASNLVFMNNANPQKYNGRSPQGYATSDGVGFTTSATKFGGRLNDGSNPSNIYGGPGVATGAEVNIMLPSVCTSNTCKGAFDPVYGLRGWSGSKIVVTKVKMDGGGLPAIWALNAQVVRANQYGCNCRGVGDPGGCGELDIAEAITKGSNTLATHNYWLNANPSTGHDTWTTRPTNGAATFVTIMDKASGVIKVLQLHGDDFASFNVNSISKQAMNQLIQVKV
ncbi:unnamed protein product [Aphanomyces euteiches]|uniref:glucan endo-1,3-beta-D-glucosidase n=1 Tax=Aphanomyces euteiches TaxID=100861 RepID=A0A6G0XBC8_9STRA|nr:hypothetical protein Ae201684_006609 [Aphanomyces euteiches]KAH9090788.1 hypothetical protein Ae201684P_006193 [Aphanomyces euteiches]KAH9136407.1 hypothetical protein AeRB84_018419 [Aphanomyces euteiches]